MTPACARTNYLSALEQKERQRLLKSRSSYRIYMIVIRPMAIRDGDTGRPLDSIDDPFGTLLHGQMIKPYVLCSEDGNPVSIGNRSKPNVVYGVSDQSPGSNHNVMDENVVDDDILNELDRNSGPAGNVDENVLNWIVIQSDSVAVPEIFIRIGFLNVFQNSK
ncbi:hypothetical protein RHGRI_028360 [Rhododendron griersonianum]|uniref:Uncharacterized protein n=1 Tax=Rhododendron griersonianum TaxID=479676 RepID=A0AAV6IJG4_9ERIC|nr:hypothetical protein RHGRI_028360 [Rhododendron griersonianum]